MKKTEVMFVGGRLDGMSVEVPDFIEYVANQEETYARTGSGFALFNGDPDGHTMPITDIVKGGHSKSYDPYRALSAAVLSRAAADLVTPNSRNEAGLKLARASAVSFLSKKNPMLRIWCDGAGLDMDYVVSKYPDILKRKLRIQELAGDLRPLPKGLSDKKETDRPCPRLANPCQKDAPIHRKESPCQSQKLPCGKSGK